MQTVNVLRGTLVVLIAVGAFLVFNGLHLRYYMRTGPGPGFFPVWIGTALAVTSLLLIVRSFVASENDGPFFPSREAAQRVALAIASLICTWLALEYLGFRLAIFCFALVVPRLIARQSMLTSLIVALTASFGVGYAFEKWLGVFLPAPDLEFLQRLGF